MGSLTNKMSLWLPSTTLAVVLLLFGGVCTTTQAQTEDAFSADPVKLFERGQNAHARGDFQKAIEYYDEAIKVRPEFGEAEFQRAVALASLDRLPEAEAGFRRAIGLRKEWSLPYSSLGALLVRVDRSSDAESQLRQAIKLDPQDNAALRLLAELRLRARDFSEALQLSRRATSDREAPVSALVLRAIAERLTGDKGGAIASLDRALQIDPLNPPALLERAEIRISMGNNEIALTDLKAVESLVKGDKQNTLRLIAAYEAAGKPQDAHRNAQTVGVTKQTNRVPANGKNVVGAAEEIEAANNEDPTVARQALHSLLEKNPDNAMLLARLGASYRTTDPARSLDFYRRANKVQPDNPDYAAGYGAALVQSRRFAEAVSILRRVIQAAPDNYVAHANLATALYRLKQFQQAVEQYNWLLSAKPDLTIAHYFIATAHDNLGEYDDALAAYQLFLAHADAKTNQLEIEKVNLRLPSLRRQIKLGQGVKRKPAPRSQN